MSNLPRIRRIKIDGPTALNVTWADHKHDHVELIGWIATGGDILAPLKDPKTFATARVGDYGASIEWGNNEDLAIDAVHLSRIADKQRALDVHELAHWQVANNFTNVEAANLLGVSRSTWATYKAGKAAPPAAVAMIVRALQDDRILIHALHRPVAKKPGRPKAAVVSAGRV